MKSIFLQILATSWILVWVVATQANFQPISDDANALWSQEAFLVALSDLRYPGHPPKCSGVLLHADVVVTLSNCLLSGNHDWLLVEQLTRLGLTFHPLNRTVSKVAYLTPDPTSNLTFALLHLNPLPEYEMGSLVITRPLNSHHNLTQPIRLVHFSTRFDSTFGSYARLKSLLTSEVFEFTPKLFQESVGIAEAERILTQPDIIHGTALLQTRPDSEKNEESPNDSETLIGLIAHRSTHKATQKPYFFAFTFKPEHLIQIHKKIHLWTENPKPFSAGPSIIFLSIALMLGVLYFFFIQIGRHRHQE